MTRAEALDSLRALITKNMVGAPDSETRIHRELMLELVQAEITREKTISLIPIIPEVVTANQLIRQCAGEVCQGCHDKQPMIATNNHPAHIYNTGAVDYCDATQILSLLGLYSLDSASKDDLRSQIMNAIRIEVQDPNGTHVMVGFEGLTERLLTIVHTKEIS